MPKLEAAGIVSHEWATVREHHKLTGVRVLLQPLGGIAACRRSLAHLPARLLGVIFIIISNGRKSVDISRFRHYEALGESLG